MKQSEMQKYHVGSQTCKKLTTVTCSKYIKETFWGISLKAAVKTKTNLAADITSVRISLPAQLPGSQTQNITNELASVALYVSGKN